MLHHWKGRSQLRDGQAPVVSLLRTNATKGFDYFHCNIQDWFAPLRVAAAKTLLRLRRRYLRLGANTMRCEATLSFAMAFCLLLAACGGSEKWENATDPLADGVDTGSLIITNDHYVFRFDCNKKGQVWMMFRTPESQDFSHRPAMERPSYQVQFRADDQPVLDLQARTSWTAKENLLTFDIIPSGDWKAVIKGAINAKTRFVVGAERNVSGGQRHVKIFPIDGANEALSKSIKSCGLTLDN